MSEGRRVLTESIYKKLIKLVFGGGGEKREKKPQQKNKSGFSVYSYLVRFCLKILIHILKSAVTMNAI